MRTHSLSPDYLMPFHFLISESDGNLYDVRQDGWHSLPPLRKAFRMHKRLIKSVADLKAAIRAGNRVWPGGYGCYFITADGSILSFEAVTENLTEVIDAIQSGNQCGWHVTALATTETDTESVYCDHTGKRIS